MQKSSLALNGSCSADYNTIIEWKVYIYDASYLIPSEHSYFSVAANGQRWFFGPDNVQHLPAGG